MFYEVIEGERDESAVSVDPHASVVMKDGAAGFGQGVQQEIPSEEKGFVGASDEAQ